MKTWMIFVMSEDHVWLETAWDDDSTGENYSGWMAEVERVNKMCGENNYRMRIMQVDVPYVIEAFDIPQVNATVKGQVTP